MTSNRKVLLVSNFAVLSEKAILYALHLSHRMEASLEVLHIIEGGRAKSELDFRDNVIQAGITEHIGYVQISGDENSMPATIEYARNKRNLLCLILFLRGSEPIENNLNEQEIFKEVTHLLNCPIVQYTDSPAYP